MSKVKVGLLFFVFLVGSFFLYSWWYQQPTTVISRITKINIPFTAKIIFRDEGETWQDSHLIYLLKVSQATSNKFNTLCQSDSFLLDEKFSFNMQIFNKFGFIHEANKGCLLSSSQNKEHWSVFVEGEFLVFEYYFADMF